MTLLEIARAAGVSKSTVSLVLNDSPNPFAISEQTRTRVLDAADRLGYRPNAAARALATGRSDTILMVSFDLWDENLVERLRGVEAHLVPEGYSVRVCTAGSDSGLEAYSEILRSGQSDGVLLTGLATRETLPILYDLRKEANAVGVPVVALADAFPPDSADLVAHIDDEGGAERVVSHVIEHGHRRIMLLGVDDQPWATKRERGYRSALEKADIEPDTALVVLGDRSQTWAYNATRELAVTREFSAMFVVTDNMAFAALAALRDSGRRVPEDCAIVGFDNNEKIARFTDPPLTTVDNPFFEAGRAAARALLDMIGKRPVANIELPTGIVIRRSCGCP
ncbi:MAG: LacI family DNA-binding transcriptional regulator [Armatimonadota bacterium]